jgi:hypothetical protein
MGGTWDMWDEWGEEELVKVIDGKSRGKRPLGRPRHGAWIILRWILER